MKKNINGVFLSSKHVFDLLFKEIYKYSLIILQM